MNISEGHRKLQKATIHLLCLKLLLFLIAIQLAESLRFTSLQLPALVQLKSNFWLSCQFELKDWEQLYSVKWYKNNEEFYRQLHLDQQEQQPQQYFAQAGVNVLMSSSNATHVRLLNASLDTEALYACEISTQNLSTIRYEREIRLYALPHSSRPTIIGFRAAYSLNDKVDLICSSDFARPRPALAWFINGRRIAEGAKWLQLEPLRHQESHHSNGLFATTTTLRFRLNAQLLAHLEWPKALRLECKLKLAEVSEVVYNQLTLAPQQLPAGRQNRNFRSLQRGQRMVSGKVRLGKDVATNRVIQSRVPASAQDLWLALIQAPNGNSQKRHQVCGIHRGGGERDQLAPLWPDDPLVAEVVAGTSSNLLNCTTAGALEASLAPLMSKMLPTTASWTTAGDSTHLQASSGVSYCADLNSRRKMLISGKYQEQTNQRPTTVAGGSGVGARRPPAGGSLERQRQRPHVAYLSLSPGQLNQLKDQRAESADSFTDSAGASGDRGDRDDQQQQWLLAPPLLEWFINNQEPPRLSANYEPELPLVAAALGGHRGVVGNNQAAPSIDYTEYFANFDLRPIHQHLVLNLSSYPAHQSLKTTSKLELRCSSTQAQVLAADSSSLIIYIVEGNGWTTNMNRSDHQKSPAKVLQTKQPRNSATRLSLNLNLAIFIITLFATTL